MCTLWDDYLTQINEYIQHFLMLPFCVYVARAQMSIMGTQFKYEV